MESAPASKPHPTTTPDYYENFRCICGACELICCNGEWAITVDRQTYDKYQSVDDGDLGPLLRQHVVVIGEAAGSDDNYARISMEPDALCPFLTDSRLCRIHLERGESFLGKICRLYPRKLRVFNGRIEKSLKLSCPEAARLSLLPQGPLRFISFVQAPDEPVTISTDPCFPAKSYLGGLKSACLEILQDEGADPDERLHAVGAIIGQAQHLEQDCPAGSTGEAIRELLTSASLHDWHSAFASARPDLPVQLRTLAELADLSFKFFAGAGYRQLGEELLPAIGLGGAREKIVITDKTLDIYRDAYQCHYQPFLERNPYVMQRFLANQAFTHWFKADVPLFTQFAQLALLYAELRFLLVCQAASRKRLDEEMVILATSQLIRNLVNAKTIMRLKLERLDKLGRLNMDHLVKIIKPGPVS